MDAERKGLQAGDILVSINGTPLRSAYRMREIVKASQGAPVELVYRRGNQETTVRVQPAWKTVEGTSSWMLGIRMHARLDYISLSFPEAFRESIRQNAKYASLIYQFLQGIIERRMSAKSLEGPIGIARLSGEAAREGLASYLGLMSMVSLNLAIFNLLPIPILDGGVILLLLLEMMRGRDFSLQFKETVMKFGFVFLMAVVALVFYNDITKIFPKS